MVIRLANNPASEFSCAVWGDELMIPLDDLNRVVLFDRLPNAVLEDSQTLTARLQSMTQLLQSDATK